MTVEKIAKMSPKMGQKWRFSGIFWSFGDRFRIIRGPFGDHLGTVLGLFSDHFGAVLQIYWGPELDIESRTSKTVRFLEQVSLELYIYDSRSSYNLELKFMHSTTRIEPRPVLLDVYEC